MHYNKNMYITLTQAIFMWTYFASPQIKYDTVYKCTHYAPQHYTFGDVRTYGGKSGNYLVKIHKYEEKKVGMPTFSRRIKFSKFLDYFSETKRSIFFIFNKYVDIFYIYNSVILW